MWALELAEALFRIGKEAWTAHQAGEAVDKIAQKAGDDAARETQRIIAAARFDDRLAARKRGK